MNADAAHRLLTEEGAGATTAADWAAATERVYKKICLRFAPIIGATAVHALLARSVKLCTAEFPCLLAVPTRKAHDYGDAQALLDCLAKLEPGLSHAAAVGVLARFLQLSMQLIGAPLVSQVLLTTFVHSDTKADDDQESRDG